MKKFLLSVVVLLFAVSLFSAPLPIGGKVEDISLDVWYKNKKSPALEALGKKYIAILFVTTAVPDPLMLGRVEKMAEELKKKNVEIFFVSNGLPKNSTDVPAWKNLSIPVAFDLKSKLFNTLGGHFERIPFWAVITPQKQLAWRGKVSLLPALINELQLKTKINRWVACFVKAVWFDGTMYLVWRFVFGMTTTIGFIDQYIIPIILMMRE